MPNIIIITFMGLKLAISSTTDEICINGANLTAVYIVDYLQGI